MTLEEWTIPAENVAPFHWLSERVQKTGSTEYNLLFRMGCNDGVVQLPPPLPPPDALKLLFSGSTEEARHFRENI